MNIKPERATINDIDALVQMRLDYLTEDYGSLTDEQIIKIKSSLPDYYRKHLNKDLLVYVARKPVIAACCFLLISEKPANPSFINGRTGNVLNVYTKPEYRKQGIAKKLMEQLIAEADELGLDYVELKSTDEGYRLYKSLGFSDEQSKYHSMRRTSRAHSKGCFAKKF
ncbi:MAG: GNAT family N-acetyltransferase [Lachnospiraceae bacterium]|nr:GNAT family N-acetyltransferase [Lachnospiraceae bacterium]